MQRLTSLPARMPGRRQACLRLGAWAGLFFALPTQAANIRRIVSVGGALTEIVFALQASADLVGVDTTSQYPASAQRLPSVGYARALSAEGVLALAPTLVMVTEDAGPPAVLRQLSASGVPVAVLAANHRFEGLCERIRQVGELTGRTAQANAMQQSLVQEWKRNRPPVMSPISQRRVEPARVLFVLAHTPNQVMVAGTGTSAQAMLEYVGAVNAGQGFTGYKPLTPEAVIAAQPDIVLLTDQGLKAGGGVDGILQLPGLQQTPAGSSRRVISMEAMFLLGFGPRLPAAISALDAAIRAAMFA